MPLLSREVLGFLVSMAHAAGTRFPELLEVFLRSYGRLERLHPTLWSPWPRAWAAAAERWDLERGRALRSRSLPASWLARWAATVMATSPYRRGSRWWK